MAKISIAISSCLLGNRVRYDGQHSYNQMVVDATEKQFDLICFCPEVAIGMSVPRSPIQLVSIKGETHVCDVKNTDHDVTEALLGYAQSLTVQLRLVSGYIFKSKSPSCGIAGVNVYDSITNDVVTTSAGQFAKVIMQYHPTLPIVDEIILSDEKLRANFFQRVVAYSKNGK